MEKSATHTAVVAILILVIASIQWQSVKGETFYIMITPGSPFCNESGSEHGHGSGADPQHCLTLQQFFTKFISKELNPTNLILKLEPGEHILDYNLTIATVVSFAMTSEAATINCTSPIRYFELHFLKDVLISGITFMDCGLFGIYNTGNFRFENSSIYEYDYGNILLLNSVIEVAIIGSTFLQNHYNGQLWVGNSSMIRIQECTFSHINAYVPVISSWDSTCLIIDSTTFENITHGTAVEIANNQESVTITNCDFINNNIGNRSETQGLFSIDGCGSIEIRGNRFAQNTGKVLSINSVNETIIDQNSFIDNAGPGAALNINAISVPLTISRNNFTRNTDGAINLLVSDSYVTVDDCNFSGNTKNENGGAAMTVFEHDRYDELLNEWGMALLKISQSSFFNNSVIINGSGGALHIGVDSPLSEVTIDSSIFSHNRAPQAGAVYINASYCTFGTILTIFDNNIATKGRGGAVATEGELQYSVFLLNSTFTNNTAPHSCGGAAYIDAADTHTIGSTFHSNLAQNCGALALNSGRIETVESNFLSNRAEADGGVICTSAYMSEVVISTGNFSYNHAERNGGVMIIEPLTNEHYERRSIHFLIQGSAYFDHNTAGSQGGVFATFSRSEFLIAFSSFFNNQAGIEGGVMYVRDTSSSVSISSNSQLGFNRAAKRGGVISINGSSLVIGDSPIFNNSADMGAVISACSSNVNFPPHTLYQYNDPKFPNCLLYDVTENKPSTGAVITPTIPPTRAQHSTTGGVTTPTIPPTRAQYSTTGAVTTPTIPPTRAQHSSAGIAVAIVVPIVCFLVMATIITAALSYAYCRKHKKSDSIGVKKLKTDDPDLVPLMGNA